jgi:hypothetical protein
MFFLLFVADVQYINLCSSFHRRNRKMSSSRQSAIRDGEMCTYVTSFEGLAPPWLILPLYTHGWRGRNLTADKVFSIVDWIE